MGHFMMRVGLPLAGLACVLVLALVSCSHEEVNIPRQSRGL